MSATQVRNRDQATLGTSSPAAPAGGLVDPLAALQLSDSLRDPLVDPLASGGQPQSIAGDPAQQSCLEEAQQQYEECVAPLQDNDMGEMPGSNERGFVQLGCMLRNMWDRWRCSD